MQNAHANIHFNEFNMKFSHIILKAMNCIFLLCND